jgi:Xaa-Pro aminopeptidase
MKGILRELNKRLEFNSLDGFIASSQANVSYLAGFPAADAYILVSRSGITYFTDSRYTLEVKRKLKGKHP